MSAPRPLVYSRFQFGRAARHDYPCDWLFDRVQIVRCYEDCRSRWVYQAHSNTAPDGFRRTQRLEGPLSLHDYVANARMDDVVELFNSIATDNVDLWERVESAERALLSPERAEPVIAKYLGFTD